MIPRRMIDPELRSAAYFGTAVSAVTALLPYLNFFFITACVTGPLAAVWLAGRKDRRLLSSKDGAQLGFVSGFSGVLAAIAVYDFFSQIFKYQLWKMQNADPVLAILADMVHDASSPSVWLLITLQVVAAAILAGALAVPSGILGVKLFQRRP